ncbi:MAG TPA: sigma-70 family RNA polymerase sigma factor [Flavitalea sp.]|nr:sigma-70 family RNA polymerase sigma factor [Flavitalea sp.]
MDARTTDNEIITRVLGGNHQLYAELVTRYQNFVFTLALRYALNREDAEEIAQDVFVKAYKALKDFRGQSKFSTWLYSIVNSTSITFLRKKKLDIRSLDHVHVFEQAENKDGGMNANQVEVKSKVEMVTKAIQLLSADDARLITLFYKAEQSLEEIARILDMETNTVKVKLHRARTRLKEKMEKHFIQELRDLSY